MKEKRHADQGAIVFLRFSQQPDWAGEMFPRLKEALTDLTLELKVQRKKIKIIPVRLADDRLLLLYPGLTPRRALMITGRLQVVYSRRVATRGGLSPDFRTNVIGYGPGEKEMTAFLRLVFHHFLPETESTEKDSGAVEELLTTLVPHIAESYLLLDQAQNLALCDDVSGLPNHRAAQTVLGEKLNKSLKEQAPFSILFVDGDNLRQYNDVSYQKGNCMIRKLGEILASQLRRGDFLARWFSGDEFLIVLPGADRRKAVRVGERLRLLVEETTRDWLFPITISVGVASFPEDGKNLEELLRKAEEANALAKKSGKNQVCEARACYGESAAAVYQKKKTC
ncbi:GGDEF domain-containing protein [Capillibacterium thermochitinicola]|uniref:GGDEF domain-containing protein n=1 Tax=Capillibacterium thermochitinicola TaxID=2699427 RepID=A0A8J6LHE8_9FIRM|nr:GGDEF domain-containing protein [Capillibacterium thermochitinicola]MBA2132020.1 GGDEF domain-containing protein [Capillibacterium thermochitinicola]